MRFLGFQMPGLKLYEADTLTLRVAPASADTGKGNKKPPDAKPESAAAAIAWQRVDKGDNASVLKAAIQVGTVSDDGDEAWQAIVADATHKKIPLPRSQAARLTIVTANRQQPTAPPQAVTPTAKKSANPYLKKREKEALLKLEADEQARKDAEVKKKEADAAKRLGSIDIDDKLGDVLLRTDWKAVDKNIGKLQCRGFMLARLNYVDRAADIDAYEYLVACATNVVKEGSGFIPHVGKHGGQVHVEEVLASALGHLLDRLALFDHQSLGWKGETFAHSRAHGAGDGKDEKKVDAPEFEFRLANLRVEAKIRYVGGQTSVCDACQGTIRQVTERHVRSLGYIGIDAAKQA